MTYEYMNGGQALPADNRNAGQLGVVITFDDGGTQNLYAKDKDEMLDKVMKAYGNTRERNRELQAAKPTVNPATPPAPATLKGRLTAEEKLQLTADMADPAKAGAAIAKLTADATGFDPEASAARAAAETREAETVAYRKAQVEQFLHECPEYYPSSRNAALLRDRVWRKAEGREPTAANYADAYNELQAENLLESKPAEGNTQPETRTAEPSAPTPPRPTGTGQPPSRTNGTRPAVQPKESYEDLLALDPSEFERRLMNEAGFAEKVEAAYAARKR